MAHLNKQASANLDAYRAQLAKDNGVADPSRQFAITPPIETALRSKLLESHGLLSRIHMADVDQIKGQVVDVGLNQLMTGRKDGSRFGVDTAVDGNEYELTKTDSGCWLGWDTLSSWANSGAEGEFFARVNDNSAKNWALDMLRIGFNGKSRATATDPSTNPNGEDVNIGWHEIVKQRSPEQIMTDPVYLDPTKVGEDDVYGSLDAMAADALQALHPSLQSHPDLVVLVGRELVAAEQGRLYDAATTPTEKKEAQRLAKSIAGMEAIIPPFFPGKRLVVTLLSNLHIYTQRGTRKRSAKDNQDRERFENQYWRMEGYAVGLDEAYAGFDESAVSIGKPDEEPAA